MKRKLKYIVVAAAFLTILITSCGSKQLMIKGADFIVLKVEADNNYIEITDTDTISVITDNINSLTLKKGKSIQLPPGWIYQLIWKDINGKIIQILGIVDKDTIGYNDHYYSISDGEMDMDFISTLIVE